MFSRYAKQPALRHAVRSLLAHTSSSGTQHLRRTTLTFNQRISRRTYATPPPQVKLSDLPIEKYHLYADATMELLLESLENLLDDIGNPDYEVEYSSGVLTLKLADKGTYVINKQPPNKQIWLSSPVSGPKRYDYVKDNDDWIYAREQHPLGNLLNTELSELLGVDVDLGIRDVTQLSS